MRPWAPLTKKQQIVYRYLLTHQGKYGWYPSQHEMVSAISWIKTRSNARNYLQALRTKGYLKGGSQGKRGSFKIIL